MEQQGLKTIDMERFFGTRGRASEVLSGKRQLTLEMIRTLVTEFGIPADALIAAKPTRLRKRASLSGVATFDMAQRVAAKSSHKGHRVVATKASSERAKAKR